MDAITREWTRTAADEAAVAAGCYFDLAAAEKPVRFFREFLRHSKGRFAGQPFELLDWQKRDVVYPIFGWKRKDGRRRFQRCYVEIPKKNGKALAVDTPIPTPRGWKAIGDIRPGDCVFDERGQICRVMATSGRLEDRLCAELRFSDGCRIVADANHNWTVGVHSTGKTETLTTWEMMAHVKCGAANNYRIPVAGALDCEPAALPVDPYILGAWLGDGHSASARLTCGNDDVAAMLSILRATGIEVRETKSGNDGSALLILGSGGRSQVARNGSLQAKLRALGVLNAKHIPALYLRASIEQRISLLQGLMDTDGYISKAGQCEFTTTSPAIRDGAAELLRSLGFKPSVKTARATINGRDCGEKYRVQFWAFSDTPVFRLPRKRERQIERPNRKQRSASRYVVSITPVDSVPVCCIQVDSPSRLYLCGESMIPTHNSTLAAGVGLYLLVGDNEAGAEVYSAACTRQQAGIVHGEAINMVRASPGLSAYLRVHGSAKEIRFEPRQSIYKALAADANSNEGLNIHGLVIDELHAWPGEAGRAFYDALKWGGKARENPLFFIITTAGEDLLSIGYDVHNYAKGVIEGTVEDLRFFAYIRAADEKDDYRDPEVWRKANPSLGYTMSEEDFADDVKEAEQSPTSLSQFKRYALNIWSTGSTSAISPLAWKSCKVKFDEAELHGEPCYGALDLARVSDLTAAGLVFPRPDGRYRILTKCWLPRATLERQSTPEQFRVWEEKGILIATEGDVTDYEQVERDIVEWWGKFSLQEFAFDPWMAEELSQKIAEALGVERVEFRQNFVSYAAPSAEFERLVIGRKLEHDGNPLLAWQISNLRWKIDPAGNKRPDKSRERSKIDAVQTLIMGVGRAMVANEEAGGVGFSAM